MGNEARVSLVVDLHELWRTSAVFRESLIASLTGTTVEPEDWDDEPIVLTRERATLSCVACFARMGWD